MNNPHMPGLDSDENDLFDFEAASSNFWASEHNDLVPRRQTVDDEEAIHTMPLTESEIEAVLAAKASKNPKNYHQAYPIPPPELDTDYSGFEGLDSFGASPNYDGPGNGMLTNLDNRNLSDYGNTQLNGFGTFEQPEFAKPLTFLGCPRTMRPTLPTNPGKFFF